MKIMPSFTLDYKLPSSGMERFMEMKNYDFLTKNDTIKFVCGSNEDLQKALEIIEKMRRLFESGFRKDRTS